MGKYGKPYRIALNFKNLISIATEGKWSPSRFNKHHIPCLDMVGVDGSSPFAPTKFGREIKHLA